jgi:branched-subunit amino acid aminotransferase/4-amino-4-deoxychorismate lyase
MRSVAGDHGRAVGSKVDVGLIETMRAREGRLPWLGRHLARLRASVATLGLMGPPPDIADLARIAAGVGERVVRLELRDGHVEVSTRDVAEPGAVALVVSDEYYRAYPHKTTRREQFGRALANARRIGAHDALLVTAEGYVAEGTAWSLFWWDNESLFTPAEDLGILPGIGRSRIMELTGVKEARVQVSALAGRSMFLVNAVRGIVEISRFQGEPVPRDPRTAELSSAFWPD